MSDQRANNACGSHETGFDYTCDDCMLPWNHYDPEEINDLDLADIKKRIQKTEIPPKSLEE